MKRSLMALSVCIVRMMKALKHISTGWLGLIVLKETQMIEFMIITLFVGMGLLPVLVAMSRINDLDSDG